MNATTILVDDLERQIEFAHQFFIGVAGRTGLGHIEGMGTAAQLAPGLDIVRTMAIDTDRHPVVTLVLQRLAVMARPVSGELIRPQPEGIHTSDIGMAVSTERGDVGSRGLAAERRAVIERHVLFLRPPGERSRLIRRQWIRFRPEVTFLAGQGSMYGASEFRALWCVAIRAVDVLGSLGGRAGADGRKNRRRRSSPRRSLWGIATRTSNSRHTWFPNGMGRRLTDPSLSLKPALANPLVRLSVFGAGGGWCNFGTRFSVSL